MKDANKNPKSPNPNRKMYCYSYYKMNGHSLGRCFKANSNKVVWSNCNMPKHNVKAYYKLQGYSKGWKDQGKVKHSNVNQVLVTEQSQPS